MNHEIRWHTEAGPVVLSIPAKAPLRQVRDFFRIAVKTFVAGRPKPEGGE
jgi:hypothetical protein